MRITAKSRVAPVSYRPAHEGRLLIVALLWLSFSVGSRGLDWEVGDGYRSAPLAVPSVGKTGFRQIEAASVGITFTNLLADERSITNRNLLSGSGVAAGDVDGDGWCDLYFCGLDSNNALYRNLGNWKFEDMTTSAGVACAGQDSTAAVFADIDGDGDLDLLVNSMGNGTRIFENDGKGRFKEITERAGVAAKTGSMSMALADIDGDGDLDLYVANFRPTTIRDQPTARFRIQPVNGISIVAMVDGKPTTSPELTNRFVFTPSGNVLEFGEPDVLFLNDGRGRFSPVSFTDGSFLDEEGKPLREPPRDWGLAVQFHDLNGDGAPDIYVCNDLFTPDRVWINDGTGRFRALPRLALRTTSTFSMGVDFADIDRDGNVDFFVVDMLSPDHQKRQTQTSGIQPFRWPIGIIDNRPQFSRNTLQINRGDGTFAETAYFSGVEASEWSWGPIFLDVDLDGFEDILVTNGQLRDFQNIDMADRIEALKVAKQLSPKEMLNLVKLYPGLETAKVAFRNRGDLTFEEMGAAWGFNSVGISQGMALADLDNDGDMDVVVNNLNGAPGIYRNDGIAPRVAVRLKGIPPNVQGIGAKLNVLGGPVLQSQEVICGGRYLSGDDPVRVFAAGSLSNRLSIEVIWRSGKRSIVRDGQPNHIYEIDEAASAGVQSPRVGASERLADASRSTLSRSDAPLTLHASPLFHDVSELLNHRHIEEPFDDFERQPLLPNRLSQLGPGVSWFDVNGDGLDDLIVGSGNGGELAYFRNDGRGGFVPVVEPPVNRLVTRDLTTILGWTPDGRTPGLLAGSSNYEDGLASGPMVRIYNFKNKTIDDTFPGQSSSTGPLALADVDGDGDLDLFVGGRTVPGRYPEAASSFLFRNENGQFKLDPENAERFAIVGLVSGVVFSDLNGDGFPELILACEWGPVRVFLNDHGRFNEATAQLGLAAFKGWWNGVTTGDLDGDGRLDIIASNWGLNSKYHASREHPRRIYYGDLNGNGTLDLVEAYDDALMGKEVPERDLNAVAACMPFVRDHFSTHAAFGAASVKEIFGERLKQAGMLEANTLASMAFLNRGDHFDAVPLPREAQLSRAFAVGIADYDGDGHEDVFLSQNFFAMQPLTARSDAGRGLWLKGDGKGGLRAVPGQESGVMVYGEQRGAALGDYDGDGRVDLVVTQNGAATKLYHNVGAQPGLRVRLNAGPANPTGVGAIARLVFELFQGPAREIHAGSGYWSQDSAVQVMGTPEPPKQIWVRWPAGKSLTADIPSGAKEIEVNPDGKLKLIR